MQQLVRTKRQRKTQSKHTNGMKRQKNGVEKVKESLPQVHEQDQKR
jgi:hypothetical protein